MITDLILDVLFSASGWFVSLFPQVEFMDFADTGQYYGMVSGWLTTANVFVPVVAVLTGLGYIVAAYVSAFVWQWLKMGRWWR